MDGESYPCSKCHCDREGRDIDGRTWSVSDGDTVLVERSEVCPRRLVWGRSWFWLDLFWHYENGVLPIAGGLLDQPYSYVKAMQLIAAVKGRYARPPSAADSRG